MRGGSTALLMVAAIERGPVKDYRGPKYRLFASFSPLNKHFENAYVLLRIAMGSCNQQHVSIKLVALFSACVSAERGCRRCTPCEKAEFCINGWG